MWMLVNPFLFNANWCNMYDFRFLLRYRWEICSSRLLCSS